jgi:hypothetical protein
MHVFGRSEGGWNVKNSIRKSSIFTALLVIVMMLLLAACGKADEAAEEQDTPEEPAPEEEVVQVVKSFEEIDVEGMKDEPLQIESIQLLEDGTVRIVPTGDLLKNAETNDELTDGAMFPFADSGKVKDIYLVRFGNGGYRTIICLMEDGSLSALSAKELIEDHITVVWDNLTGRDTYTSVEQKEDGDSFSVVGITKDDEEIELDFSLDF